MFIFIDILPSGEVNRRTADGQHQLPQQYQPDYADAPLLYADIDDSLSEEWQHQLEYAANEQPEDYLGEVIAVLLNVSHEERERSPVLFIHFVFISTPKRYMKKGKSLIPLSCERKPFIFVFSDSAAAFVGLLLK